MGEVQINHGGVDLPVTEKGLDGVKVRAAFKHVGGEGMAQGMDAGVGKVEFLAGHKHQALERADGHRIGGRAHARLQPLAVMVAAPGVGKEQERVAVESPVAAQVLDHRGRQRDHAVLVPLAPANHELVLVAQNVVDGQREAFGKAQAAAVDELEGDAVTAQPDMNQQIMHLRPGEHGGQFVVILGFDLGENGPVMVAEHLDKEDFGAGHGLTNGLRLPALDALDMEDVVAQLVLGDEGGITAAVLLDEAHAAVVGMAGSVGVGSQGQTLGILGHGRPWMLVVQRVNMLARVRTTGHVATGGGTMGCG